MAKRGILFNVKDTFKHFGFMGKINFFKIVIFNKGENFYVKLCYLLFNKSLTGFYRGASSLVVFTIPMIAVRFASYEFLKNNIFPPVNLTNILLYFQTIN